jgi:hypothetical protein
MNHDELIFRPPRSIMGLGLALVAIGGAAMLAGLIQAPERFWPNVLLLSFYLLSLGLGALVFLALQYVTAAGWSVAFRRVPEAMVAILPVAAIGLGVVFLVRPSLYPWVASPADGIEHNPLGRAWFNYPAFLSRAVVYLSIWLILGWGLVRNSRRQDFDRASRGDRANIRLSSVFLVAFAVTFWLACTDWLMSLEPEWQSTVFALYQFGGVFLGGLAEIILLAEWLRWLGPFRQVFSEEHRHDLGKLLFGFSSFWMYLWFCQYLLIWYVNNPEETSWLTRRMNATWAPLFLLNLVLNWAIPFVVLLPRATKQSAPILAAVSLVVLAGRWLDLYLVILPTRGEPQLASAFWEIGLLAGAVGLFALVFFVSLSKANVIPVGDPFLLESLPTPMGQGTHNG